MPLGVILTISNLLSFCDNQILANKTLSLLEEIGITCKEMKDKDSRKLIFVNEELKLKFFLAKGPDVPTYVEYGAADIGVVGKIGRAHV